MVVSNLSVFLPVISNQFLIFSANISCLTLLHQWIWLLCAQLSNFWKNANLGPFRSVWFSWVSFEKWVELWVWKGLIHRCLFFLSLIFSCSAQLSGGAGWSPVRPPSWSSLVQLALYQASAYTVGQDNDTLFRKFKPFDFFNFGDFCQKLVSMVTISKNVISGKV